jgi:hypothetical protein
MATKMPKILNFLVTILFNFNYLWNIERKEGKVKEERQWRIRGKEGTEEVVKRVKEEVERKHKTREQRLRRD